MKKLFLLFLLFYSVQSQAQYWETGAIITLHPSLGSRIMPDEKKLYSLFPEYPDSVFESAQFVRYNDSTFTVLYHIKTDSVAVEKPISRTEMWAIYYSVELIRPAEPPKDPAEAKKNDKYARFIEGINTATDILGYTVLWSFRILNIFAGGEWK